MTIKPIGHGKSGNEENKEKVRKYFISIFVVLANRVVK